MTLADQRVLIVEDEVLTAMTLAGAVEDAGGVVVAEADSVKTALGAIEADDITAAVLDLNVRDGETTPVALALAARGIPFIVYTGGGLPPRLRPQFGEAPVYIKPMFPNALMAALAAEIAAHEGRRTRQRAHETRELPHVLLIEDEEAMALILDGLLRSFGYGSVDKVDTEDAAIAASRSRRPDLIVADIGIVAGSGLAAARAIRICYGVPMVVVTARPDLAKDVDTRFVVAKPFTIDTLKSAVETAGSYAQYK